MPRERANSALRLDSGAQEIISPAGRRVAVLVDTAPLMFRAFGRGRFTTVVSDSSSSHPVTVWPMERHCATRAVPTFPNPTIAILKFALRVWLRFGRENGS